VGGGKKCRGLNDGTRESAGGVVRDARLGKKMRRPRRENVQRFGLDRKGRRREVKGKSEVATKGGFGRPGGGIGEPLSLFHFHVAEGRIERPKEKAESRKRDKSICICLGRGVSSRKMEDAKIIIG